MNRIVPPSLLLASIAALLAACGAPSHEVVTGRDGTMRASTTAEAADYCRKQGARVQVTGKAPAETGVFFRCDR